MKKNKIIIFTVVFLLIFGSFMGVYFVYRKENSEKPKTEEEQKEEIKEQYQGINKESEPDKVILDYQKYFNNDEIIGELEIPNSGLKVPVSQTGDNDFYLNHLVDKSYNTLGSIFLDYRNKLDDRKLIIYGHNSKDIYTEFNVLENYLDKNYYLEHPDIYLRTISEYNHYKIFSVFVVVSDFRYINLNLNDEGFNNHLRYLKGKSAYDTGVEVSDGDKMIVLQTCYFNPENSYLIIVGKMV